MNEWYDYGLYKFSKVGISELQKMDRKQDKKKLLYTIILK